MQGKSKIGKFADAKHLLLKHEPFDLFWKEYYAKMLVRFQFHYWKMKTTGTQYILGFRLEAVNRGDVVIEHDFTNAAVLTRQNETQNTSFGGNSTSKVGMEGYSSYSHEIGVFDAALLLDFDTFISDSSVQEARTVYNHMFKLIKRLRKAGKLLPGQRLLCVTDGCAKVSVNNDIYIYINIYIYIKYLHI